MAKISDSQRPVAGHVVIPLIGIVGFIAIAAIALWLYNWVPGWTSGHIREVPRLGDLASAGQFFSLVFGIPLAFITLLLGVIGAWHFSSSRDEVEILRFYEEKILTPFGERLQKVTARVQELIQSTNICRDVCNEVWKRYVNACGPNQPTPSGFSKWLSPEDRSKLLEAVGNIIEPIHVWADNYQAVLTRTYETALAFDRIDQLLAGENGTAIAYLCANLPPLLQGELVIEHTPMTLQCKPAGRLCLDGNTNTRSHADDPYFLCQRLLWLAEHSDEIDAEFADVFGAPGGQTTVEYLGALLYGRTFDLVEPLSRPQMGDVKIKGYIINLGAAIVLTLFQYLPTRKSLCRSFAKTYGTRSGVSQRFVLSSGPEPAQFLSASVYQSLVSQLGHWERLLLVRTTAGLECYEPERHGPIAAEGYSKFLTRD
jgi:hypothetical protein